jgi:hypothetical protein
MSETAIRTGVADESVAVPAFRRKSKPGPVRQVLLAVASLRVTVVLFVLALLLVFFSTMAMMDMGLENVLHNFFRNWGFAWIPLEIFVRFGQVFLGFPHSWHLAGSFPFFSGWWIGAALMTNLLAAHFTRFRLTWKRSGVLVLHTGILVLMVSEFITGKFSVESRMIIPTGGSSNYTILADSRELAFINHSDPKVDDVVSISGPMLEKGGLIQDPRLPVDVQVVEYQKNTVLAAVKDGSTKGPNIVTAEDGGAWQLLPRNEVSGVNADEIDMPSVQVTLFKRGTHQSLGNYNLSFWFDKNLTQGIKFPPQTVSVDGKAFTVEFRQQRSYKPYTIHLKEFHHDQYPGTDIPKNYSSLVQIVNPATNENRQVNISMNEPMFYSGETFYQSSLLPGDAGTILQVVHNPAKWHKNESLAYWGCILVALGMLLHFGIRLTQFLVRRFAL